MGRIVAWGAAARALKREVYTLYYACRDPRVPWYAKAVAGVVVAYALSPIDLIPDFIPVLGYLDELVLVPLGVALVLRLIPADVLADCRRRAEQTKTRLRNWVAAGVIVLIWIAIAAVVAWYLFSAPGSSPDR
jgi:uncharacterized membrane protein YkvA (DUF1232 family)